MARSSAAGGTGQQHVLDLRLAPTFSLEVGGRRIDVPHRSERVLAFLALTRSPVPRARLAADLWPECDAQRAAHNLRTALWRLSRLESPVVVVHNDLVALAPTVAVDVHRLTAWYCDLVDRSQTMAPERVEALAADDDLLHGWDEAWVVPERERFRLLRMEAIEAAAVGLVDDGRYGDALRLALTAIAAEPLREAAWRELVRIHLRQGNVAEAVRAYRRYRTMLLEELAIRPSALMQELVEPLLRS